MNPQSQVNWTVVLLNLPLLPSQILGVFYSGPQTLFLPGNFIHFNSINNFIHLQQGKKVCLPFYLSVQSVNFIHYIVLSKNSSNNITKVTLLSANNPTMQCSTYYRSENYSSSALTINKCLKSYGFLCFSLCIVLNIILISQITAN